jgi:hypothetical protein
MPLLAALYPANAFPISRKLIYFPSSNNPEYALYHGVVVLTSKSPPLIESHATLAEVHRDAASFASSLNLVSKL